MSSQGHFGLQSNYHIYPKEILDSPPYPSYLSGPHTDYQDSRHDYSFETDPRNTTGSNSVAWAPKAETMANRTL